MSRSQKPLRPLLPKPRIQDAGASPAPPASADTGRIESRSAISKRPLLNHPLSKWSQTIEDHAARLHRLADSLSAMNDSEAAHATLSDLVPMLDQKIAQLEQIPGADYTSDRAEMRKVLHQEFYRSVAQAAPMIECPVTSCTKKYSGQDGKITGLRNHITIAINKDPNDGHRLLDSLLKERECLWCRRDFKGLLGVIKHQAGVGAMTNVCAFTEEAKKELEQGQEDPSSESSSSLVSGDEDVSSQLGVTTPERTSISTPTTARGTIPIESQMDSPATAEAFPGPQLNNTGLGWSNVAAESDILASQYPPNANTSQASEPNHREDMDVSFDSIGDGDFFGSDFFPVQDSRAVLPLSSANIWSSAATWRPDARLSFEYPETTTEVLMNDPYFSGDIQGDMEDFLGMDFNRFSQHQQG